MSSSLIILSFQGCYRLDVSAARRLYIDGVEDLLHRYNTDKVVRPYLHNFPFTLSNLDIALLLENRSGGFVPRNFVASVFNVDNRIIYCYFDEEQNGLLDLHEESYEDAVRIVHAEREAAK